MMQLNDYQCETCGSVVERFCEVSVPQHCFVCGDTMAKLIKATFKLDGTDPSFPTAADKWAKRHEKMARKG
jgi:hypothetical protein